MDSYKVILFSDIYSAALMLDFYDKKQPTNKLKIRILSETSIFDSSRFIYSDRGSSHVKTYSNRQTLLEEK